MGLVVGETGHSSRCLHALCTSATARVSSTGTTGTGLAGMPGRGFLPTIKRLVERRHLAVELNPGQVVLQPILTPL